MCLLYILSCLMLPLYISILIIHVQLLRVKVKGGHAQEQYVFIYIALYNYLGSAINNGVGQRLLNWVSIHIELFKTPSGASWLSCTERYP